MKKIYYIMRRGNKVIIETDIAKVKNKPLSIDYNKEEAQRKQRYYQNYFNNFEKILKNSSKKENYVITYVKGNKIKVKEMGLDTKELQQVQNDSSIIKIEKE